MAKKYIIRTVNTGGAEIVDIFNEASAISLAYSNGVNVISSSITDHIGTTSMSEASAGYEGFNIALQNLTIGNSYKLYFTFQVTSGQWFANMQYRFGYMISDTNRTDYSNYTQWNENLTRDLAEHSYVVDFTATAATMYLSFNICGFSDSVTNYFTISGLKVESGGVGNAEIAVDKYVDNVFDSTFSMISQTWSDTWKNFDNLIRVEFESTTLKWVIEVLGNIEGHSVGDLISWAYSVEEELELLEFIPDGFAIELMNNTEELNKITKTPTLVRTLYGHLKEETDIVDPEILIEFSGVLTDCNYMHIPLLNRYYFITKIDSVRTNLWRISAHCDVLKTYSEGILGTEAVVARSESKYNLYLNDPMFKVYTQPRLQIANFPQKFTGESFVLVMNGAKYST